MRLIITRPKEDSRSLAEALRLLGHESARLPLLSIVPRNGVHIPARAWAAICLTSANAVRVFKPSPHWLRIPVLAVGEQSARAASQAGFEDVTGQGGDVVGLAASVKSRFDVAQGPLLYLSGAETSGDLEGRLRQAGYDVHRAIVYDAIAMVPDDFSNEVARAEGVLLYSPRTAKLWSDAVTARGLSAHARQLMHYCLSENVARQIAEEWPRLVALQPTESSLLAMLAPLAKEE